MDINLPSKLIAQNNTVLSMLLGLKDTDIFAIDYLFYGICNLKYLKWCAE